MQTNGYTVRVTQDVFKSTVTRLTLEVNQTLANDVAMQLGEVTSSVEVQATAPLVERETSSTGQVITGQEVLQMPLNGRNVFYLSLLVPGASENPGAQSNFSINGARGNQTSILLDGVDARLFLNGKPTITPSVDVVQEFKIQQNANSAAYGDGFAIINTAIRSGTNSLHGNLYELIRNDKLDATPYFSKTTPILLRNQFGFAVGGPVWKNHTFFFGGYEGGRIRTASTLYALIPTAAQLSGNFAGSAQLYDPFVLTAGKRTPYELVEIGSSVSVILRLPCAVDRPLNMRGDKRLQDGMFSDVTLAQRVPPAHPLREIRRLTDVVYARWAGSSTPVRGLEAAFDRARGCSARAVVAGVLLGALGTATGRAVGLQPAVPLVRRPGHG